MSRASKLQGLMVLVGTFAVAPVYADAPSGSACGSNCQLENPQTLGIPRVTLDDGVSDIIRAVSFIAGVLSIVFIIIAGIRYATSSGNPNRIEGGKNTLLYAVIGLIISIFAYAIVGFVVAKSPQ